MSERSFGREVANVTLRVIAVFVTVILIFAVADGWYEGVGVSDGTCNIAVLPIEGVILPFSGLSEGDFYITPSTVRTFLDEAEQDPFIDGVMVEINSPGGTPVAASQIAERIFESSLPTVGVIGDVGASGGYLVGAATDHLIASAMSDVGSLGVTMSYVEESKKNEEEGLTFVPLASGTFKDAGNPNKPLTEEERALFERDLELVHNAFVNEIATYREVSFETIDALADGSSMTGGRAMESALIDELGGRKEARAHFANTLSLDPADIVFCEYEPPQLWL
jgi:protease-4